MHTYRGAHGLIINHNGDCSGMAILRYQGTEIEVPAAEIAPYVEQERIVREIAEQDNYDVTYEDGDKRFCRYCDAEAELFWDEDDGGNRYAEVKAAHEPDCLFGRARAIVARLDGKESE